MAGIAKVTRKGSNIGFLLSVFLLVALIALSFLYLFPYLEYISTNTTLSFTFSFLNL